MRWVLAALIVAGCSPQQPVAAPETKPAVAPALVEEFDAGVLTRIAADLGYKPGKRVEETPDQDASLELLGEDGQVILTEARHCAARDGVRCEGINLTSRIVTDKTDDFDRVAYANDFNREQAAVYMYAEDGDIFVSDDIILDGGVTEPNLRSHLQAFFTVLYQHKNFLAQLR